MRRPQPFEFDLNIEPLDIDALARALSYCPTMTPIQAHFFSGHAGESFLDWWDESCDGPRPEYYAMREDGLVLRVVDGQMGIDVCGVSANRVHGCERFHLQTTRKPLVKTHYGLTQFANL